MRCIAGEKDVAHLQITIDPMRNLKIRFPYRWTGRLNVFKFAKRIFLGTYYSPDWILLWRLVYVVNDADEENKPITIEEKYVAHIFFERYGERQIGEVPRFFKTASGKINIQSFSGRAVRSVGSQKPRREYGFMGIVRALSQFGLNASGFVATSNQFHSSLDFSASFFKGF